MTDGAWSGSVNVVAAHSDRWCKLRCYCNVSWPSLGLLRVFVCVGGGGGGLLLLKKVTGLLRSGVYLKALTTEFSYSVECI